MIAFLRGRVAAAEADALVIDVGGVGYRVNVTAGCAAALRGSGDEVQLHTHMIVREDEFQLYGFVTTEELTAFMLLLGVNGVGPKAALAVLSSLTPRGLGRALALEDVSALTRVPGVGKKTAQRMILELKEKFARLAPGLEVAVPQDIGQPAGLPEEAVAALMALGYSAAEAREAVGRAGRNIETGDLQELIRAALRMLDQSAK